MSGEFRYGFHGLGMVFFWLLILLLVVLLFRGASAERGNQRSESARDILDRRFAAGEIDQQEYQDKKQLLT